MRIHCADAIAIVVELELITGVETTNRSTFLVTTRTRVLGECVGVCMCVKQRGRREKKGSTRFGGFCLLHPGGRRCNI